MSRRRKVTIGLVASIAGLFSIPAPVIGTAPPEPAPTAPGPVEYAPGDRTFYAVPDRLQSSYGLRPVSFQVFLRLRPAAGAMGRMWNMHMIKPMHPAAPDPHAGHHMP